MLALSISSCIPRTTDGYKPPLASDGLKAHEANWQNASLVSGLYRVTFTYDDGKRIRLNCNMAVEPESRARVDLSSDRGAEAVVTLTPEFINLLNHREKYYIREKATPYNAGRMVGLELPVQEAAALLCGEGFATERFDHLLRTTTEEGGTDLSMYHKTEALKALAYIDPFGRLRHISYLDSVTEEIILRVNYGDFRVEKSSGFYWPGKLVISILRRHEQIELIARDVDINNERVMERLDKSVFVRLARGTRLDLEAIPPGDPVLYRNLKVYVEEAQ
jgi:hypothetical protein